MDNTNEHKTNASSYAETQAPEDQNAITIGACSSIAERDVTITRLEIHKNELVAVSVTTQYGIVFNWPLPLLEKAMFYNIVPFVQEQGANTLVTPNIDTLFCAGTEETAQPVTEWSGYEAAREISFKTKKNTRVSRLDNLIEKLASISSTHIDIVSAEARLRTLEHASPVPHGETSEMTFGSTAQIAEQRAVIARLVETLATKREEADKQLAKINEALTPIDTDWQVQLPDSVDAITRLNVSTYSE